MGKTSCFNKLHVGICMQHLPNLSQSWNYMPSNLLLSAFFSQPQRKKISAESEL